jgi:hypothetical protein
VKSRTLSAAPTATMNFVVRDAAAPLGRDGIRLLAAHAPLGAADHGATFAVGRAVIEARVATTAGCLRFAKRTAPADAASRMRRRVAPVILIGCTVNSDGLSGRPPRLVPPRGPALFRLPAAPCFASRQGANLE